MNAITSGATTSSATTSGAVVVGLDRSEPGRAAVEYAAELARHRHLPLHLVHAFEVVETTVRPTIGSMPSIESVVRNSADRLVDETVEVLAAVYPDVKVTSVVEKGSPARVLLAESEHANTIVLGSRGTGGFAELVIGSTTMHVAAHAACPVIAVPRPPGHDDPRHGVVVGVDGSALSEAAIGYAFEVASELGEPLIAIHAWHDPSRTGVGMMMPTAYDPADIVTEERLALAESLAGWQEKFPEVVVEKKVVLGHPVPALASRSTHARMLVVGSRGRGALSSLVLGSVSHGVLHHATGPVAIVHNSR
jgi:nucleotide-binding universal stress UspA family protein